MAEATKEGAHTETLYRNATGTSIAPTPVQFVPPKPRCIPFGTLMISQAFWTKVMTRLSTIVMKVG